MSMLRGRDMVISVTDGENPELVLPIAGLRARLIALSARLVDATTAQSKDAWRELIAGAATKRVEIAGNGAFWTKAASQRMRAVFFAGETPRFEIIIAGFGVLDGPFAVAELSYGGEHDSEATFSVRLASAGVIAFTSLAS